MSQIIEIPFQNLGINTEIDDDQNPGWVRQERTYFINGKVEKVRGSSSVFTTTTNIDPDIVNFWKYDDKEFWLVFDEVSGKIYRFDKDLSNPTLLYTASTDDTRIDIEGQRAIIYSLGQAPLTSLLINRGMYHGIVGNSNYPKYNDTFLDWNRVRVYDDIASPSAGKKLFLVTSSEGSNAQKWKNPGEEGSWVKAGTQWDQIIPFSKPSGLCGYRPHFMFPKRTGILETALDGSVVYYYRYSLVFDGQQESELSETILNTSGVDFNAPVWDADSSVQNGDNFMFNSMFRGTFTIDIGNPYVDGSFYPGNPRVTGINIYRSTDPSGLSDIKYKKIITASTLNANADLNALVSNNCTSGAGNFMYDNCDFTQIGITTDDYVYQAGIGNISEIEPDNNDGNKQTGLLKFSSSTLGNGRGCHPDITGEPWKDISSNYVIVNRDLDQPLDEHGTYWCADLDGLKDAGGSNDTFFATSTSGTTTATHYNPGRDETAPNENSFVASNMPTSYNRQIFDWISYGGANSKFIQASFNTNAPASLAASTEYHYEIYFAGPGSMDDDDDPNYVHLLAYEGASAPTHTTTFSSSNSTVLDVVGNNLAAWTQSGYTSPPVNYIWHEEHSGYTPLVYADFAEYPKRGHRFCKVSGTYTTDSGTPKFTLVAYTAKSSTHFATPHTDNIIGQSEDKIRIQEFLITKKSYVKRKGHNGASTGLYSDDFNVLDNNVLENYMFTIPDWRGYPTTSDKNGWIVGNYGKCVLPWDIGEQDYYDFSNFQPGGFGAANITYSGFRALNSVLLYNSRIPTNDGDGSIIMSPNYKYAYNTEESGELDTTTNDIMVNFDFIDAGIADGADHPGTQTLSTDVRYKYQTSHIGRRFVGNVIINGDSEDSEKHEDFIMYSELGNPDVIPIGNFIKLNDVDGGDITGLAKSLGDVVALMERGVFILSIPSTDITQWTLSETYKDIGCTSSKSVCEYNNGVFFANEDNFYYLDSGRRMISLADPWLNTYQNLFKQNGITQVMINPTKAELMLIFNNATKTTYALDLIGFEQNARWHKDIQYNTKSLVVDNLKNMYSFNEEAVGFSRSLVLHSLDKENADEYPNLISYDMVLETPYQKLTDLDRNVIIRKLNLRYNSVDEIYVDIYTDGDDSAYKKRVTIPASSTDLTYDDSKDYTYESNIKLRANRIKVKISTPSTTNTLTSIRRLELEVD